MACLDGCNLLYGISSFNIIFVLKKITFTAQKYSNNNYF